MKKVVQNFGSIKEKVQGITSCTKKCFLGKEDELQKQHTFLASAEHPDRGVFEAKGKELTETRRLMSSPVLTIPEQNNEIRIGSGVKTKDPDGTINNYFIDGTIPPKKVPLPPNHFFISTGSECGKKWLGKKVGEKVTRVEKGKPVTCTIVEIEPYSESQKIFFPEYQLQETTVV